MEPSETSRLLSADVEAGSISARTDELLMEAEALLDALVASQSLDSFRALSSHCRLATCLQAAVLLDGGRFGRVLAAERGSIPNALKDLAFEALESTDDLDGLWVEQSASDHDSQSFNVMSLLLDLPPATALSCSLLLHPLLGDLIERSWWYGPAHVLTTETRLGKATRCPPWLHHLWSQLSYFTFVMLSVSLAVQPTSSSTGSRLTPRVLGWLIFGWAHVVQVLMTQSTAFEMALWLPSTAALLLQTAQSSATGAKYSFVSISVIPLFLRLLLPLYPSLPFLFPTTPSTLLPLSVLLNQIINRGMQVAALVAPLILVVFAIFSWALNGDIFRAGSISLLQASLPFPQEDCVAPFEARAALAIAFLLLVLLGLLLFSTVCSRSSDVPHSDAWSDAFGPAVACESRRRLIRAMQEQSSSGLTGVAETSRPGVRVGEGGYSAVNDRVPAELTCSIPAPRLIPPFNLPGVLLSHIPSTFVRAVARDPRASISYRRAADRWLWVISLGWVNWPIVWMLARTRRPR